MIEPLENIESYILNETNMNNYLKYKLNDITEIVEKTNPKYTKSEIKKHDSFIPREQDTLFWCYYIIKYSDIQYEMLQNRNFLTTKQLKIDLVSKIRENKQIVKNYKFDTISNIENNLANDDNINIKTFMTLCAIDNINIVFITKNSYYELLTSDSTPFYIIREIKHNKLKYNKQYSYEISNENLLNEIYDKFYKVESIDKPIKSLSSYKVSDLLNIANKLAIEIIHKETGKKKSKNELYESIIQYF